MRTITKDHRGAPPRFHFVRWRQMKMDHFFPFLWFYNRTIFYQTTPKIALTQFHWVMISWLIDIFSFYFLPLNWRDLSQHSWKPVIVLWDVVYCIQTAVIWQITSATTVEPCSHPVVSPIAPVKKYGCSFFPSLPLLFCHVLLCVKSGKEPKHLSPKTDSR